MYDRCRGSDIVTDMSTGDVVCRDCGTCLRDRCIVDDTEMRLDEDGGKVLHMHTSSIYAGEQTTMRGGCGGKNAAQTKGLDDRSVTTSDIFLSGIGLEFANRQQGMSPGLRTSAG